jgi:L-aminopeptidase/D-esterase-like protein
VSLKKGKYKAQSLSAWIDERPRRHWGEHQGETNAFSGASERVFFVNMSSVRNKTITDVSGIKVGHFTNAEAATGCTVVICEEGAVAGVDVRGAAPGTRETDLLRPGNLVKEVHAILISGGSAFGLDAAGGVMQFLEERGIGFETTVARVPIVPGAILFDLGMGRSDVRPDAAAGYVARENANSGAVIEGSVGAGTGCTVGKAGGIQRATKSGLGTWSETVGEDIVVGALAAVNALGEVLDPDTGHTLAGVRTEGGGFETTIEILKASSSSSSSPTNTTLGVVATNALLSKEEVNHLACVAHSGLARVIRPSHTMADGDTIFFLSLGKDNAPQADLTTLGAVAAEVMSRAIVRAATEATGLAGVPAMRDLVGKP